MPISYNPYSDKDTWQKFVPPHFHDFIKSIIETRRSDYFKSTLLKGNSDLSYEQSYHGRSERSNALTYIGDKILGYGQTSVHTASKIFQVSPTDQAHCIHHWVCFHHQRKVLVADPRAWFLDVYHPDLYRIVPPMFFGPIEEFEKMVTYIWTNFDLIYEFENEKDFIREVIEEIQVQLAD